MQLYVFDDDHGSLGWCLKTLSDSTDLYLIRSVRMAMGVCLCVKIPSYSTDVFIIRLYTYINIRLETM